ncbi:hypothetical protein GCM10009821_25350 [Aeromicrobium halocynthiae]|uniref:ABC transmembrane type-1 domain-containing protein n=1 Tax=Aeromicrobium halocynthiae TaxID=560557 RepID=A0ABP5HNT3_9ACTN
MRPTVRSRLWAAGTAFVLGFAVANVGVLVVPGVDRWVWLAVAIVLMITGAVGVLLADTARPVSFWAVLGVELMLVLTVLPLLWTFTVATSPGDPPTSMWPRAVSWEPFGGVLAADGLRTSMLTSAAVAAAATAIAMLLAVPASYALVRRRVPGRRWLYLVLVILLVAPLVTLAGPTSVALLDVGMAGRWWSTLPLSLLVALPLASWLSVTVMRAAPWHLRDAVRADGATRRQELRHFAAPALAPGLLVVAGVVFLVTAGDTVAGAALAAGPDAQTLPASLLLAAQTSPAGNSEVAAAGLLWLVPVLVLLLLAPRRIVHLIGRTHR